MQHSKYLLLLFFLVFFSQVNHAQNTFTISGYVNDLSSNETLIGANIYNKDNIGQGTTSNIYGFYSITLPEGDYTIVFSYLGFTNKEMKISLTEDKRVNVEMAQGITIEEVVVTSKEKDENVSSTEMGTVELEIENIKKLPALMGEVDILKTLQLLPGVLSAGEGNSGFYVRGGGPDQNLVLLDEAVVYNSGHMLGFFSVFNADAIKNTSLIKGNMPAYYGGRLSSVVDIQMKDGNNKHFAADGGIGLIASRLTFEGPIIKEKSSFIISARRTYAFDLAQGALKETNFAGTNYFFYDINAKINHRFSDKDRIYLSTYFGRDVLNYESSLRGFSINMPYGNKTATLRWNHLFTDKLFMNVSAIYNDYDFELSGEQSEFFFKLTSGVRDYNGKIDFDLYANIKHHIKFGINYTFHRLTPNTATARSSNIEFSNDLKPKFAHESAIYVQDDIKLSDQLSVNVGLRASLFTQVGPYTSKVDGTAFKKLESVKTYSGIEPRISGKLSLSQQTSLKAGITMTNQYIHLVSNSSSTLPTDVWVPSSETVKPQKGIQYALGYFQNFANNKYELAVEVYYKDLQNQIDYGESRVEDINSDVEDEFVFGKGRAYGLELFLKKRTGKLNGWIGYTLSKTDRSFNDIMDGKRFPTKYDRTHDLAIVMNYELKKKWDIGASFIYGTGGAFTPVKSLFLIENNLSIEYGDRNSARLEAYHRFDVSATWTPKKKVKKDFKSSWTFSVYNIYNRRNPLFTYYAFETNANEGTAKATGYKVSLFPVIPSITWNFHWK